MAVYVHITTMCRAEAAEHGQTHFVESARDKIVETQTLGAFDQYLPSHFIKKGLGRSFRLIGYSYPIGDDELILFVRTLARGGKDYAAFLESLETNREAVERQLIPDESELAAIYDDLTKTQPVSPLPAVNDEERAWLHQVFGDKRDDDEVVVLESDEWVTKVRSKSNADYLVLYHEALEQIHLSGRADQRGGCEVAWDARRRAGVVYKYWPDTRRLLLLEPIRSEAEAGLACEAHDAAVGGVLDRGYHVARLAGRAYPYLMVLDREMWLRIEKDDASNLALSPEEVDVLDSIRSSDSDSEVGFPLFINGRAGSGKSTMLQYLAADFVEFGLRRSTTARPIYMTSSPDLLERARQTVQGLLTVHHRRLLYGTLDELAVVDALRSSFVVFREYLHSLLEPEERARFRPDKRVGYAEFRRLWADDFARRPEAKRFTVDVAWHTIRSYIKGTQSTEDDELGPEEFLSLPRKRRSVSPDTYERVFVVVWEGWYKRLCEEKGLWDDQDLAATVLASGKARSGQFSAVFCDEAQDFTPLELEVIFQLSLYSQRSLNADELRRVPIVFAGDPLQTINPTGFRWDAVQADFHEKYLAVLDPKRGRDVEISYRELRFNYRSNPGIVHFCNLIQLARGAVLNRKDVAPQDAWGVSEAMQTAWFAADDGATASKLQQRPELIKIVNCEEGEESLYAEHDPILKDLGAEADNVFRNVLGPTRAKGLEFPAVVLYKFSESAPANFARIVAGDMQLGDDPESDLPFEYFFNRLYVAASRARSQLVVIDSSRSFRDFWRFATDAELVERWMSKVREPARWKESITYLVQGRAESWTGERVDPLEQATEFAEKGRHDRDPYLMRLASLGFRDAKQIVEAERSGAEALEFEGKWAEAGHRYLAANLHDDAYRCFWQGRAFDGIRQLSADPRYSSRLESRAADYMRSPRDLNASFITEVCRAADSPVWRRAAAQSETWGVVVRTLLEGLARAKAHPPDVPARRAFEVLADLRREGLELPTGELATLAYLVGDYAEATTLWEQSGRTDHDDYRRAKARATPFPENIAWLGRLKAHKDVTSEWREHARGENGAIALDEASLRVIVDAALAEGDVALAIELIERRPDEVRIGAILREASKRGDADLTRRAAAIAVRQMVAAHDWTSVVRFAEKGEPVGYGKGSLAAAQPLLERSGGDHSGMVLVMNELARSPDLAADAGASQSKVTEFLHRTYVRKGFSATVEYGVPVSIAGSAIERAGRAVEALQYYEAILADPRATQSDRAFAAERHIRSLERHSDYLRSRGDDKQATRQETRAKKARQTTGLRDRRLSDFPDLDDARPRAALPLEPADGPFRIVTSAVHQRFRIEHADRFETVTVDGKEMSVRGDVAVEGSAAAEDDRAVWQVPAWGATIRLHRTTRGLRLEIEADGRKSEGRLRKHVSQT